VKRTAITNYKLRINGETTMNKVFSSPLAGEGLAEQEDEGLLLSFFVAFLSLTLKA